MRRVRYMLVVLCLLSLAACERRATSSPALARLLQGMHARLELMHAVARVKWNAKAPILDQKREESLLQQMVERGQRHGIDAETTRAFFAAQMDAAKRVQEDDFERWTRENQPPFADTIDLPTLRQKIDTLNTELLQALAEVLPLLDSEAGQKQLEARAADLLHDISPPTRDAALRPLRDRIRPQRPTRE